MKQKIRITAAVAIALAISAAFTIALLVYTQPMEEASYNLSLRWEGEAIPEDWSYDDKGWTAFTQENDIVTKLHPDGFGGFSRGGRAAVRLSGQDADHCAVFPRIL